MQQLDKCKKVDLLLVADVFMVQLPVDARKAELRQLVVARMWEKGLLTDLLPVDGAVKADMEQQEMVLPVTPTSKNPLVKAGTYLL